VFPTIVFTAQVKEKTLCIQDKRGRHSNHRQISVNSKNAIRRFISNLNVRESHYSRENNPHRSFLPSGTAISLLYRKFLAAHPEYEPNENNVDNRTYFWLFRKIFNTEFNIGVGYPRSDLCNTCELLSTQIKVATREGQQAQLHELEGSQLHHWDSASHFYAEIQRCTQLGDEYLVLCCDFEKNFSLPITGINREYFSSHLNVYNFGVKNMQTGEATMFFYPQNYAKKSSNEVASILQWYINQKIQPGVRHVIIFADNSAGQNKNRFVLTLLHSLCYTHCETVTVYFPVPGHSFLPIDRDFAILEKKRKKLTALFNHLNGLILYGQPKL